MTTEEMNVDIALYMGGTIKEDLIYIPEHPVLFSSEGVGFKGYAGSLKFHTSFDWLMPVWSKLRGELMAIAYNDKGRCINSDARVKYKHIESYITEPNISQSHQLIHAAIVWLKSK